MPEKTKKNLDKIEREIEKKISSGSFDDCIKQQLPVITSLVDRLSTHLKNASISFTTIHCVINITVEVYHIINQISDCVIDDNLTEDEKKSARMELGKDITYFIWMTADPLANKFKWIPFKKSVERKLVRWIAGLGLEAAVDLISANAIMETMSDGTVERRIPSQIRGFPFTETPTEEDAAIPS